MRACLFVCLFVCLFYSYKRKSDFCLPASKNGKKGKASMDLMDGWKKVHKAKSCDDSCSDGGGSDEITRPPRVTSIPTNINTKKREKLNGKVWFFSIANFFTYHPPTCNNLVFFQDFRLSMATSLWCPGSSGPVSYSFGLV